MSDLRQAAERLRKWLQFIPGVNEDPYRGRVGLNSDISTLLAEHPPDEAQVDVEALARECQEHAAACYAMPVDDAKDIEAFAAIIRRHLQSEPQPASEPAEPSELPKVKDVQPVVELFNGAWVIYEAEHRQRFLARNVEWYSLYYTLAFWPTREIAIAFIHANADQEG